MKHENPATLYCVATGAMSCDQKDAPGFAPTSRGQILPILRVVRRQLGLSTGDLLVLNALLSHLPCRDPKTGTDRPITPDMLLVIFAGNRALCDRANGMDERVLRRHISRLTEAGLVVRRSSASGKRFPLKRKGAIVDAFGIDLTPLFKRMAELREMAERETEIQDEIKNLRARAMAIRARRATGAVEPEERERLADLGRVLRRTGLTLQDLRQIIAEIETSPDAAGDSAEVNQFAAVNKADNSPEEPQVSDPLREPVMPRMAPKMSGSGGQNVRLEESQNIEDKKSVDPDPEESWHRCAELKSFYPDINPTPDGIIRVIYDFGRMLNVNEHALIKACQLMGVGRMLRAMDYLARNAARISRPERYLERMIRDVEAGVRVGWA
ncbi:helix-turn-helix domain-containing protein [Natronohydrobacter thiooxidans]|uniref:helix-turn-helix domain-containing protein n=1 Tax=Natronohydrobacter thiooxidans TaxID=87172 RepID=UPI0009FF2BBA|nr:helix-turn-helix domain-containing protein [Natronohydrobacter thiooxidans]